MKFRNWLQGAGAAALLMFPFYRTLLDRAGEVRMHTPASIASWALSLVVNLVVVSLLIALLGTWLSGTSGAAWLRLLVSGFVLASVVEVVQVARTGWVSTHLWLFVWFVALSLSLLLRWRWQTGEKLLYQFAQAVLVGVGFFSIFVALRLLHFAVWHPMPNSTNETVPTALSFNDRPRTIWILLDGMSYKQAFEDRYLDLELPEFDDLKGFSTVFTQMQPAGDSTELAIPSILLGDIVTNVNYNQENKLEVATSTGRSYAFDASRTPFATARRFGLTTGVVGWYNPYCAILAPYLNQCYWTNVVRINELSATRSFWQNFLHPWALYGRVFVHPRKMFSRNYREHFLEEFMRPMDLDQLLDPAIRRYDYEDLMQHAAGMLKPSGPDFVFIHLCAPHEPGFYNRKTHQFDGSRNRSYIDNVALTDKALGQFMAILRQSPRWKNTNLIISSDHSWRTFLWKGGTYWTPEDQAASHGGVFDSRPLLMIHLAGQTTPATVSEPFPLLRVHDILDDLVTGKRPTFPVEQAKDIGQKDPSSRLKATSPCPVNHTCE
jgi:hypothetical protein